MSRPSASGSMMSRITRSGRSRRNSSMAPLPVWLPATAKPSLARLYFSSSNRSESSSITTIFFIIVLSSRYPDSSYKRMTNGLRTWQTDGESRSSAELAFHRHFAAHLLDGVADDGEAQAGSAGLAGTGFIGPIEALENSWKVLR